MSKIKTIYNQTLLGKISPFQAANILKQHYKTINNDDEVEVLPQHVISRINDYLEGKIDEEQLYDWASFIIAMEGFVTPHWKDNYDLADKYEPMWLILQHLSTPQLDGCIDKEIAVNYIDILKKLP